MKKTIYYCDSCHCEVQENEIYSPYGQGAGRIDNYETRSGDSTIQTFELNDILLCPKCNAKFLDFLKKDLKLIKQ